MRLTEIRINLCPVAHVPVTARGGSPGSRLRAFVSLTFDDTFVVRDVKLIEGNDALFLAMPSRKLADHCPACREKNHLRARFCNQCGGRLDDERFLNYRNGNGTSRLKLHADVAHPINARCRHELERRVVDAYWCEVERSRQPGYVPPSLDHEDFELYDAGDSRTDPSAGRPVPTPRAYPVHSPQPSFPAFGAAH
jgi:stage V sporulation protein G